ncbi:MAG TPA: DNA-directed RNA polymerase subunit B, partial [Candidatus Aenigmarchaeota archaeon]|nr:DNA-directed RNA polymerase subunit B [Candidatus Aenigmarchaeota archaeon]
MSDVYLNGKIVGSCEDPIEFVRKVRELRRSGELPQEINVAYREDEDAVVILNEKGRARRPLIIVENGKPKLTEEHIQKLKEGSLSWDDLISMGIIEYLDAEEEENCLVAMEEKDLTEKHTHLEITPIAMLSVLTALVPYIEHNQAFRALLGPKSLEQGLGLYVTNFLIRADTDSSLLIYPQRPIVRSIIQDYVGYEYHPIGQNVVIAVMQHYGYNMDDAIVINKGSIERGFGRSIYYRPYKTEELKYPGGQVDKIEIPSKDVRGYRSEESYRFLEEDGIIYPEAEVKSEDVLIGKTSPPRFLEGGFRISLERKESSQSVRFGEKGIVESVVITESSEGNKLVEVKVRDERIPELGDKFASRHGQKGVMGMIVPQEDMP